MNKQYNISRPSMPYQEDRKELLRRYAQMINTEPKLTLEGHGLQERLAALQVRINDALEQDPVQIDLSPIIAEYETLLINSWCDEDTGLLTGAIDYIRQEIPAREGRVWTLLLNNPGHMGNTQQPIALFHDVTRKGDSIYGVAYQNQQGHFVNMTQFEATVRVREDEKPYQVYRPFLNDEGQLIYRLVREVQILKVDYDYAPAYLNYLIVKADGRLYKLLERQRDFDEDVWYEMFMEIVLGERRLPNFNTVVTAPEHAAWLHRFMTKMDYFDENLSFEDPDTLERISAFVKAAAAELHELTQSVAYHYDTRDFSHEDDADMELEGIDAETFNPQVGAFS